MMKTLPRLVSLLLLPAGLLCSMLCPAAEPSTPPNRAPTIYDHPDSGLRLEIPQGWLAAEAKVGMSAASRLLLLTINNQRPGFRVETTENTGRVMGQNRPPLLASDRILTQLQPGEISLRLDNLVGGEPDDVMMTPNEADAGLRQLLAANPIKATANPELSALSLRFHQGGQIWTLQAFLRAPITAEKRKDFISMLEGMKFAVAPVTNARRAAHLAWQHLPEPVRGIKDTPPPPPQEKGNATSSRVVSTEPAGLGYRVTITLARMPSDVAGFKLGDTWVYFVSEDGKVTLQSGPAGSAPTLTSAVPAPAAAKPGN